MFIFMLVGLKKYRPYSANRLHRACPNFTVFLCNAFIFQSSITPQWCDLHLSFNAGNIASKTEEVIRLPSKAGVGCLFRRFSFDWKSSKGQQIKIQTFSLGHFTCIRFEEYTWQCTTIVKYLIVLKYLSHHNGNGDFSNILQNLRLYDSDVSRTTLNVTKL